VTVSADPPPHATAYRPDIDGLRAIAVLSVVAFHAFPSRLPGGFIGVDVFFVISGFLISQNIFRDLDRGHFSFWSFYARRVRRIFPALTVVLAAVLVMGWHALLAEEFTELGKHVAAGAGFASNIVLWAESGYFDAAADQKPLLHLWSLGIEEQFYVVWPLLIWMFWRLRASPALTVGLVGVGSFLYSQSLVENAAVAAFYNPLSRVWELALGGLVAAAAARMRPLESGWTAHLLGASGLVMILAAAWLLTPSLGYPGWAALIPTLGCALIIIAGPKSRMNQLVLSTRGFVWIGLISFPLYLWHWPLLSFLRIVSSGTASGYHRVSVVLLSIGFAWLTYLLVERPIRRRPVSLGMTMLLTVVLAVVGVAGYAVFRSSGFPTRLLAFEEQIRAIRTVEEYSQECRNAVPVKGIRYCMLSDPAAAPTVALFGDSHANRLFAPLSTRLKKQGHNVLQIGGAGCVPFWGFEAGRPGDPNGCDAVMRPQLEYLRTTPSITTIILLHRGPVHIEGSDLMYPGEKLFRRDSGETNESKPDLYRSGLTDALTRFRLAGKNVVVLLDAPEFPYDPTSCLDMARPYGSPFVRRPDCRLPRAQVDERNQRYAQISREVVAQVGGAHVVDLKDALCDTRYCYGIREGKLLYRDSDHLNLFGAEYVVDRLWPFPIR